MRQWTCLLMAPSIKKGFHSQNELCRHHVCHQSVRELGHLDDWMCVWHSASLVRWFLKLLIGQSRSLPFSQFWSPSSNWQRSQRIKDKPRSSWSPVTVGKLYPSRNKGMYTGFIQATSFAWCWLGEEMENYVVIRARQQNLTLYHWEQSNNQSWWRHLLTTLPQIKIFLNTHPTPATFEQPPTLKHTHLLT